VVQRNGSFETIYVYANPVPLGQTEQPLLAASSKPPLQRAFHVRIEIPIGYPPKAARQLLASAQRIEREILISLGYSIPQRMRVSRLTSKADKLRVAKPKLKRRGLYEIVAATSEHAGASEDERRRMTIKTQRHRARRRLVEPYTKTTKPQEK
jgi:hypothetical protein